MAGSQERRQRTALLVGTPGEVSHQTMTQHESPTLLSLSFLILRFLLVGVVVLCEG